MSEYWVSKNKYYCKYCKVYITDDKPSKQHHETGLRHKGNLERYIREIYKKGAKQEKDKAEEERAMRAIDAAAAAAMGISATASTSSSSAASASDPSKPKPAPPQPFRGSMASYSTAESLGFIDPDVVKATIEKQERLNEGRMGEWSYITPAAGGSGATPAEGDAEAEAEAAAQERRERDPDRRRISFSYLREKSLPDEEDMPYNLDIKVKVPRASTSTDPISKAILQAKTLAPPDQGHARTLGSSKGGFKAVVAQEIEDTPEEIQARQQAAWDLIASSAAKAEEDADPSIVKKEEYVLTPDGASPSNVPGPQPMFRKRKAGAASESGTSAAAKRRG